MTIGLLDLWFYAILIILVILMIGTYCWVKQNNPLWIVISIMITVVTGMTLGIFSDVQMRRCQDEIVTMSSKLFGVNESIKVEITACQYRSNDDVFGPYTSEWTIRDAGAYSRRLDTSLRE